MTAWNEADFEPSLDAVDPDITIDWSESHAPYAGVYVGIGGWRRLFRELPAAFSEARTELHEYVEAGPSVALRNTAHLRGRDGIEVTASSTIVFTFRDDKLVSIRLFQDHDDALAAIGHDDRG